MKSVNIFSKFCSNWSASALALAIGLSGCGGGGGGGSSAPDQTPTPPPPPPPPVVEPNLDVNTLGLQDTAFRACVGEQITAASIKSVDQITSLDCSERQIESSEGVQNLTALMTLNLSGNRLLQDSVDQLSALVAANNALNFQFDVTFRIDGNAANVPGAFTLRELVTDQEIVIDSDGAFSFPFGGVSQFEVSVDPQGVGFCAVAGGFSAGAPDVSPANVDVNISIDCATAPQVLFLDFDGATINAAALFGAGNTSATLSPLASFLEDFGLTAADEDDVIDAIVASFTESVSDDFKLRGLRANLGFNVDIRNSRDDGDLTGMPNVSVLVVGGTIAESGISTIGIASSIDVGNFETQDTAITLLDLLSADFSNPNSLNGIALNPELNQRMAKIALIGQAVGNITAHEAGHFLGNFHTDQFNDTANIMDQGGNLLGTIGVGDDRIFGTADDVDVDFVEDTFVPTENRRGGIEDTQAVLEFGMTQGQISPLCVAPQGFRGIVAEVNQATTSVTFDIASEDQFARLLFRTSPDAPYQILDEGAVADGLSATISPQSAVFAPVVFEARGETQFLYNVVTGNLPNCFSPLVDEDIAVTVNFGDDVITDCVETGGGCPLPITDGTETDLSITQSTIVIDNCPIVEDVNVAVDIEHTFVGDIAAVLTRNDLDTVLLFLPRESCVGQNVNAVFDEEAAVNEACRDFAFLGDTGSGISADTAAIFGTTRSTKPVSQTLDAFKGQPGNGQWTLSIADFSVGDTGTLNNWGLNLTCSEAQP